MAKKKEAKPQAPKNGRVVPKEISVKLTDVQCLTKANQASQISKELTELEEAFKLKEAEWKQVKAAHKAAVKNHQEQIKKLLVEVKNKAAVVTEDVLLVLNHEEGTAEYWYPVKGDSEIVDSRPLEDGERQLSLVEKDVAEMPDDGQDIDED
jgi:hypothetical protein